MYPPTAHYSAKHGCLQVTVDMLVSDSLLASYTYMYDHSVIVIKFIIIDVIVVLSAAAAATT